MWFVFKSNEKCCFESGLMRVYKRKEKGDIGFCFENCIRGALTISTPGVKVRLEYPRQAYIEIENFAVNIKSKEYNILLSDNT